MEDNTPITTVEASDLQQKTAEIAFYKKHMLPCIIYAFLYVLFMYGNYASYTSVLWTASLSALVVYCVKAAGKELKRNSCAVTIAMLLIALSSFFTGNKYIHILNQLAEFMLLLVLVLHNFADDSEWDFGKFIFEVFSTVFLSIGRIYRPITDTAAFFRAQKKSESKKGHYIGLGILIAVPSVIILCALLASADMVFSSIIGNIFDRIILPGNFFGILFMFLFGFLGSYCGICYVSEEASDITYEKKRNGEPIVAITIMSAVTVLYLVFSAIQIAYLFIGGFTLPDGITYAEYARTGFFQLLFVCVLNLICVLLMKKLFRKSKALDIILIIVSGCTYIMIASSAMRMILYIRAYHLTFMRVFVLVALLTLAVLLAGVIISVVYEGFSFFRFGVAVLSVIYILFAFSHVDYFIAKYNIETGTVSYQKNISDNTMDFSYISELSSDAAPYFDEFFTSHNVTEAERNEIPWYNRYKLMNEDFINDNLTVRKFNLSAYFAKKIL